MRFKAVFVALLMVFAATEARAQDYDIQTIEDHARVRTFKYQSYDQCYLDAQDQVNSERLSRKKAAALLSQVPKGGVLLVDLLGAEWRMANGPNWTYLVTDQSGNVLFRTKGHNFYEPPPAYETKKTVVHTRHGVLIKKEETPVAPAQTAFGDRVFVVSDKIEINVSVPDTFKVVVIDNFNDNRCLYLLTKTRY